MNRLTGLALACFFVAVSMPTVARDRAQNKGKSASHKKCVLSAEDYGVYSAALLDRGKPEDPEERWDDKPDLIISDVTDSGEDGKSGMWGFRSASNQLPNNDTVDHFNLRRQISCHLNPQLDITISYRFLSEAEHDRIFKKKGVAGWEEFYKKYPKSSGYWNFSPVGYDSKEGEALI